MIRLGKDKVDERFNILEDGTIVDLNGNAQKLSIYRGRSHFKSVAVHKIQIWTNFGWRDGHKWAIHHLDEDKLNNSLSNLVYLTHSEHTKLHTKGNKNPNFGKHFSEKTRRKLSEARKGKESPTKGMKFSDESRKKMSNAKKGNKNALGHQLSEESRKKMSNARKGKNTWTKGLRWFNDGVKNYRCKECPPGCVKGRLF